jgi:hypothetical protein
MMTLLELSIGKAEILERTVPGRSKQKLITQKEVWKMWTAVIDMRSL